MAEPIDFNNDDAVFVVSVSNSYPGLDAYEAARYAWRISPTRAKQVEHVLAVKDRKVVGVFRPKEWMAATPANFPGRRAMPGRIGFVGSPCEPDVASRFMGKELPREFRFSGNGYRYAGKLAAPLADPARPASDSGGEDRPARDATSVAGGASRPPRG